MTVVTNRPLVFSLALMIGLVVAVAASAPAAMAQGVPGASSMKGPRPVTRGPSAPPSALPGAQSGKDRVIPSDKSAIEMSPTDALFDAITRGDISAAQDAINRGADFNARNMLGLTPLDESIDLGRNNITFLLLSLRSGADSAAAQAAPASAAGGRPAAPTGPLASPTIATITPSATAPTATDTSASAILSRASATKANAADAQTAQPPAVSGAAPEVGRAGTPSPKSGFNGFGG